jgi:alginate O-acetyltransferase complex protein AlgI
MKNFETPYFATSITDFWRRWHISLSSWFRDYVYIPLGGSRKSEFRVYLNLFIVFVVSGLWHGAAITFIIWGFIHGCFIVAEKACSNHRLIIKRDTVLKKAVFTLFTFVVVCFAWIFFRSNSFSESLFIAFNLFNFTPEYNNFYQLGLKSHEFDLAIVAIVLLVLFDFIHRKYNAIVLLNKTPFFLRSLVYVAIIYALFIFGIYGENSVSEFIYFQF